MAKREPTKKKLSWDEFECPDCSAHNPYGNTFTVDDEIFCSFCGNVFRVKRGNDPETYRLVQA